MEAMTCCVLATYEQIDMITGVHKWWPLCLFLIDAFLHIRYRVHFHRFSRIMFKV
jgi:hypothetical protein